jgi:uncharacterized protein YhfF/GNAT superfamily N-acetyltransferase
LCHNLRLRTLDTTRFTIRVVDPQGDDALSLLREAAIEARALYPQAHTEDAPWPGNPPTPPGGTYVIAYDGAVPIASGALRPLDSATVEVRRVYVSQTYRRRGVARRVLAALESEAAQRGYDVMRLETGDRQQVTMALYEACGFVRIAPFGEHVDDPTSVCFEKPIAHARAAPTIDAVLAELRTMGVALPVGPVRLDRYGDSAALSQELLALIRAGRKRAGTSLLWAFETEGQSLPRKGDIEIVLDHLNRPAFVTRIVQVEVLPYGDVTADYAALEGEGDGSLDHWRRAHWSFFGRESARIAREPSMTMPVVCSVFEVLQVLPTTTTSAAPTAARSPTPPGSRSACRTP